jgi:hypothetical protein
LNVRRVTPPSAMQEDNNGKRTSLFIFLIGVADAWGILTNTDPKCFISTCIYNLRSAQNTDGLNCKLQ